MPQSTENKDDEATKETVTCRHCRYEYPASADRCTVCGYPWPWLSNDATTLKKE